MLKYSEDTGLSELGDCVRTTTFRNVPLRQCSRCPMLFIKSREDHLAFCALYGHQVEWGAFCAPNFCKIIEVVIKEKFEK